MNVPQSVLDTRMSTDDTADTQRQQVVVAQRRSWTRRLHDNKVATTPLCRLTTRARPPRRAHATGFLRLFISPLWGAATYQPLPDLPMTALRLTRRGSYSARGPRRSARRGPTRPPRAGSGRFRATAPMPTGA